MIAIINNLFDILFNTHSFNIYLEELKVFSIDYGVFFSYVILVLLLSFIPFCIFKLIKELFL